MTTAKVSRIPNSTTKVHLGITAEPWADKDYNAITNTIYLGTREAYAGPSNLVIIVPVPDFWKAEIKEYYSACYSSQSQIRNSPWEKDSLILNGAIHVGYIAYTYNPRGNEPGIATTMQYHPKESLWPDIGKGFPYYIEALTTIEMKSRGFTHIKTTTSPTPLRKKQVERVGLPGGIVVPIDKWLMGMVRGIINVTGTEPGTEITSHLR